MSTEKIYKETKPDSYNKDCSKPFVRKIITRTKWFLHSTRNSVANSNSAEISYRIGSLLFFSIIISSVILIAFYPRISIYLIPLISLLATFCFFVGFVMEIYQFWQEKNELIKKVISISAVILSPISFYCARCIFVYITGLEPFNLSRSLIVLSLIVELVLWLGVVGIILLFIYCLSYLLPIMSTGFSFWLLITSLRNNPLYLFWFRKTKAPIDTKKNIKVFQSFEYSLLNRSLGASLLLLFIIIPLIYVGNKPNSLIPIVENIIVYGDYRPNNKISECTNIEQGDWGLLAGYQKISIAHPKKLGGYSFTTKLCLFD